jgi:hypothetical protein
MRDIMVWMKHWCALWLGLVIGLRAPAALASTCVESTFQQRMERANVVFVGWARSIDEELATTFDVERVYKGAVPARVVVHTNRVKYAMLSPPARYLVYAVTRPSGSDPGATELLVETCGGSVREDVASGDLALLGPGAPAGALESVVVDAAPLVAIDAAPPDSSPPVAPPITEATAPGPAPEQPGSGCAACSTGDCGSTPLGAGVSALLFGAALVRRATNRLRAAVT